MGFKCVAADCHSSQNRDIRKWPFMRDITFVKFPKGKDQLLKWVELIKLEKGLEVDRRHDRVCSRHFDPEQIGAKGYASGEPKYFAWNNWGKPMSEDCCIPGCPGVKIGHKFPKDPALWRKWKDAILVAIPNVGQSIVINDNVKVCQLHFKNTDYRGSDPSKKRLKTNVIPSVFNSVRQKRRARKAAPIVDEIVLDDDDGVEIVHEQLAVPKGKRSNKTQSVVSSIPDTELMMLCVDEALSPAQKAAFEKAKKQYDAVQKRIDEAKKDPYQIVVFVDNPGEVPPIPKLSDSFLAKLPRQPVIEAPVVNNIPTSFTPDTPSTARPQRKSRQAQQVVIDDNDTEEDVVELPSDDDDLIILDDAPANTTPPSRKTVPAQLGAQPSSAPSKSVFAQKPAHMRVLESNLPTSATKRTADQVFDGNNQARKRGRKQQLDPIGGASDDQAGTLVPLDEYYYGKKEGDPAYREEKGEYAFKCWYCHKMLYNNQRIMGHMQGHIDNEKQQNLDLSDLTRCKQCYKQFDTPFEMQCHVDNVHQNKGNILICRICEKDHETQNSLTNHMKNVHNACEMPYICQLCNFRSSVFTDVVDHFKKRHDSSQNLLCVYCLKVFKVNFSKNSGIGYTQNYYQHLQKHQLKMGGANQKKCSACKLAFLNKQDLNTHRQRDHLPNFRGAGSGISKNVAENVMVQLPGSEPPPSSKPNGKKGKNVKSLNAAPVTKVQEMLALKLDVRRAHTCKECTKPMSSHDHYSKYIECTLCRFATICAEGYTSHMIVFHGSNIQPGTKKRMISKGRPLASFWYCLCGFKSKFGNRIANHLVECSKRTSYKNPPEQKWFEYDDEHEEYNHEDPHEEEPATPDIQSPEKDLPPIFGMLGLVKKTQPQHMKKELRVICEDILHKGKEGKPLSKTKSPVKTPLSPVLKGDKKWEAVKLKDSASKTSVFLGGDGKVDKDEVKDSTPPMGPGGDNVTSAAAARADDKHTDKSDELKKSESEKTLTDIIDETISSSFTKDTDKNADKAKKSDDPVKNTESAADNVVLDKDENETAKNTENEDSAKSKDISQTDKVGNVADEATEDSNAKVSDNVKDSEPVVTDESVIDKTIKESSPMETDDSTKNDVPGETEKSKKSPGKGKGYDLAQYVIGGNEMPDDIFDDSGEIDDKIEDNTIESAPDKAPVSEKSVSEEVTSPVEESKELIAGSGKSTNEPDQEESESTENISSEIESANVATVETESTEVAHVETESNAIETKSTEVTPVETKSTDVAPVETESTEVAPVETESTKVAQVETESTEVAPVETESTEVAPGESESTEVTQSNENPALETNSADKHEEQETAADKREAGIQKELPETSIEAEQSGVELGNELSTDLTPTVDNVIDKLIPDSAQTIAEGASDIAEPNIDMPAPPPGSDDNVTGKKEPETLVPDDNAGDEKQTETLSHDDNVSGDKQPETLAPESSSVPENVNVDKTAHTESVSESKDKDNESKSASQDSSLKVTELGDKQTIADADIRDTGKAAVTSTPKTSGEPSAPHSSGEGSNRKPEERKSEHSGSQKRERDPSDDRSAPKKGRWDSEERRHDHRQDSHRSPRDDYHRRDDHRSPRDNRDRYHDNRHGGYDNRNRDNRHGGGHGYHDRNQGNYRQGDRRGGGHHGNYRDNRDNRGHRGGYRGNRGGGGGGYYHGSPGYY